MKKTVIFLLPVFLLAAALAMAAETTASPVKSSSEADM